MLISPGVTPERQRPRSVFAGLEHRPRFARYRCGKRPPNRFHKAPCKHAGRRRNTVSDRANTRHQAQNPMSLLDQSVVLVLNRHWQAINTRTPAEAFCQLATGAVTALDVSGDSIRPVTWAEWLALPVREGDRAIRTVRGAVRVPTVIVAVNFARVPKRRPTLTARNIRERDGSRCQYTGRVLRADEGNLDHVVPRSRGGADSWENLVWAAREVNTRKGNRLPHEAGLQLLRTPSAPKEVPVTALIRNTHGVAEWDLFLGK